MNDKRRERLERDFDSDLRWWLIPLVMLMLMLAAMPTWPQLQEQPPTATGQPQQLSSEFPPVAPVQEQAPPALQASAQPLPRHTEVAASPEPDLELKEDAPIF
jgi:hypothetical protein